jgi:ubiquinol-cytochrome c reductase cytochrome b subunit
MADESTEQPPAPGTGEHASGDTAAGESPAKHGFVERLGLAVSAWLEDRTGLVSVIGKMLRHPVPRRAGWNYIWGSATLTAFMIQVVSGTALALIYVPSTSEAYSSLQYITHTATLGSVLRGMHYFGASAMVLLMGIHMARVFLMAAYKYPRTVNWLTGLFLLFVTLGMGFTGQLLRWDQDGVWSVVVGAEQAGRTPIIGNWLAHLILGGDTVGGTTLSRFFAIHVFFIPGMIFALIGLHLYLVLRHGISEPPKLGDPVHPKTYKKQYEALLKKEGVPFFPDAIWRDAIATTVLCLVIVGLALFIGPPELGKPPNPTLINAVPRPDWYLMWYFSVLALLPHGTEKYLIILLPALLFVVPLFLPLLFPKGERSLWRRPWAPLIVLATVLIIAGLWKLGVEAPWTPRFDTPPLSAAIVNSTDPLVVHGAELFHDKSCLYCHLIDGQGGIRGPDLSNVADRLDRSQMTIRISNGGYNMPAYTYNMTGPELKAILAFLQTRKNGAGYAPHSESRTP